MSAARSFQRWFDKVTTQSSARAFREAEALEREFPSLGKYAWVADESRATQIAEWHADNQPPEGT